MGVEEFHFRSEFFFFNFFEGFYLFYKTKRENSPFSYVFEKITDRIFTVSIE